MHKKIFLSSVVTTSVVVLVFSIIASLPTRAAAVPPTPSITGPTSGAVLGSYSYTITMYRNAGSMCRLEVVFDNGTGSYGSRGPYSVPAGGSATTKWDTNWLKPGTYSVRAQVQDACNGNSGWSPSIAVTITPDTTPPTAPSFFYGGASSTSLIDLTFGNSTDNAYIAGYKVYRDGSFLANASGRTSDFDFHSWGTYADTGLSASTTYTYTFAAYDPAGNISSQSDPVSFSTLSPPDTASPSKPTNLSATTTSSYQIDLSWTASTDNVGVAGYRIYRNDDYFTDIASPSFSDIYVSANTTYSYTVAAYDAAGNLSPQSSSVSATTQPTVETPPPVGAPPDTQAPTAPTELTVTDVLSTQINFTWTAPTDNVGVVGYNIYRNGELIDTTVDTHYNDHNQNIPAYYTILESSTTYSYKIAAYDAAGNISSQSNLVSAKTLNNDAPIVNFPPPDTTPDDNGTSTPPVVPPNGTTTPPVIPPNGTSTPPVVPPTLDTTNDNGTSTPPVVPKEKEKTIKDKDQIPKDKTVKLKFTRDLRVGSKGDDVKALQQILISEGVFSKGKVTGTFDSKTKAAVVKFQNKYKPEILTPMRLKKGNGIVGATTRAKLNAIYNLSVVGPTIFSLFPSSGLVGSKFTITGTGFTPTGNKVKFGDLGVENDPRSSVNSTDSTTLSFSVPGGNYLACWSSRPACMAPAYMTQPGTYNVSVINANGISLPKPFTVTK